MSLPGLREPEGIVVRPRKGGGPDQVLVFEEKGVFELVCSASSVKLGSRLPVGPKPRRHPTYDPYKNAVYHSGDSDWAEWDHAALRMLDADDIDTEVDAWTAVDGYSSQGQGQGQGARARFRSIHGLAADGRGGVWVLDDGSIRRFDVTTREVSSLPGAQVPEGWHALALDTAAGALLAATARAVCRVHTERGGRVELLAGELSQPGETQPPSWSDDVEERLCNAVDGDSRTARFGKIALLLPLPFGRLLIADGRDLRCLDAGGGGAVSTLLRGCFLAKGAQHMALLPYGDLAVLYGSEDDDCSLDLSLVPAPVYMAGAPPCPVTAPAPLGRPPCAPPTVTVRVGGIAFPVRPSVLTTSSAYFARLLAPGGGFADSGAAEAALPDADPAAFAHLLQLMLCASVGLPCIPAHHLPAHVRHPIITLAQRLLVDGPVWEALSAGLVRSASPDTALSDLLLAEAHGMDEAARQLRSYVIEYRESVDLKLLDELVEKDPKGTIELVKQLFRAPRLWPWAGAY